MNALTPDLTIVIPVRNDAVRLRRCLDAIRANATSARVGVIVADNGSTDDSRTVGAAAGATVLSLPGYRVGELRNIAAHEAASTLIAFVDADHIVDPGWIEAALDVFQAAGVAAAGAPYSLPPTANWVQRAYNRTRPLVTSPQPTDWLGSGNLIIRRAVFEQVGGFDTRLESCEDVDLCNRLRQADFRLLADPRLRSVHLGEPATLRAVFFGELWRGRDNIRVTLRGPLTARALPSVAIPLVQLVALASILIGGWMVPGLGIAAGVLIASLIVLRAAKWTLARPQPTLRDLGANLVVGAVYDVARALSLVVRATHRMRRERAGERAIA